MPAFGLLPASRSKRLLTAFLLLGVGRARAWRHSVKKPIGVVTLIALVVGGPAAQAWGPAGHQTVGAIADSLIAGTNAGKQVKKILGTEKLATAALWADCAKGVTESPPIHYVVNPQFKECTPFQSAAGKKAMVDFVKRNLDACHPAPGDEKCHRQYHFADVAIQRNAYARTEVGTSDHDIVSAMNAAIAVLQGGSASAPISLTSKKEALRVLAHYVGDVHQPLHVGAVYLDGGGHEVDPDSAFDPSTKTQGGNLLLDGTKKLHGEWDDIPTNLNVAQFKADGVAQAKLVPATVGPIATWPATWASDTVVASHAAFQGLAFGSEDTAHKTWPVTEPTGYADARATLQKEQLVKAGARFAQLLQAIFP